MKSALGLWLVLTGLMVSHVGCCSVRMAGDSCGAGMCNDTGCGGCGQFEVPFSGVGRRVANRIKSAHCSSGCGEIYWDEHINDPPVCDPCGCNGEFTGEHCGSCPTALGRLRNLWGHRYHPSGNDGCATCVGDHVTSTGTSTCSSCSSGSSHAITTSIAPARVPSSHSVSEGMKSDASSSRGEPTPAVPRIRKSPQSTSVTPTPDSNAMGRPRSTTGQVSVGSGISVDEDVQRDVPQSTRSVRAKPTSAVAQAPRRLVTNPK